MDACTALSTDHGCGACHALMHACKCTWSAQANAILHHLLIQGKSTNDWHARTGLYLSPKLFINTSMPELLEK